MTEIIDTIFQYGVPTAIAFFVLMRLERSMARVEQALLRMTEIIARVEIAHR